MNRTSRLFALAPIALTVLVLAVPAHAADLVDVTGSSGGGSIARLYADGRVTVTSYNFVTCDTVAGGTQVVAEAVSYHSPAVSLSNGHSDHVLRAFADGRVDLILPSAGCILTLIEGTPVEPYVVRYLAGSHSVHFRVWSDGQVDRWERDPDFEDCDDEFVFVATVAPASGRDAAVVYANFSPGGIAIVYGDGSVDYYTYVNGGGLVCTIQGEGGSPFCSGDTDRDGVIDFADLQRVLSDWGPCE